MSSGDELRIAIGRLEELAASVRGYRVIPEGMPGSDHLAVVVVFSAPARGYALPGAPAGSPGNRVTRDENEEPPGTAAYPRPASEKQGA